jgi:hypothetical protein
MKGVEVSVQTQPIGQHGRHDGVAVGLLVALGLLAGSVDDLASVGRQTCNDTSNRLVNTKDTSVAATNKHFGNQRFLNAQNNTIFALDADGGTTYIYQKNKTEEQKWY